MYYGVGASILAVLIYVVWASFFNAAPTCFDGAQNGTELGIDCGGSCSLVCSNIAKDPTVLWARVFPAGTNAYTAAAYVQNNNLGSGAKGVRYSFQLFDDRNALVKEVEGTVDLPPVQVVPVIMPNINVGNRTVSRVQFAFTQRPVWRSVLAKNIPTLLLSQQNLNDDASRLSATINNQTLIDAKNVTVVAVLFDNQGVARAASRSLVAGIGSHSFEQVTFTWPNGTPDIVRAEITVLPSF